MFQPSQITSAGRNGRLARSVAKLAIAALALSAAPALASSGGTSAGGSSQPTTSGAKAKLVNGYAVAPKSAPRRVKDVIAAANRIAKGHGYCLGGGHSGWKSSCYDCSGSVSYALHGGDLINAPKPSGALEHWGRRKRGGWITVYANGGHTFVKIAGLRFDTADTKGAGPGWARGMGWEKTQSYKVRHKRPF